MNAHDRSSSRCDRKSRQIMSYTFAQLNEAVPPERFEESEKRILTVDDEEAVRNLFAMFLSDSYECATAPSAEDALVLLAQEKFALVISDMMMPGRNGVELLR